MELNCKRNNMLKRDKILIIQEMVYVRYMYVNIFKIFDKTC